MSTIIAALEAAIGPPDVRTIALAPTATLFRQGDATQGLAFLSAGRIDLIRHSVTGTTARIHVARAGETFAEASLFSDHYHCDAVAVAASQVQLFAKAAVLDALEDQPVLNAAMMHHLAASLRETRQRIALLFVTPLSERLYLRLAALSDADGAMPACTPMNAIAEEIGATPEATYRALAQLERQGRVARVKRGTVRLMPTSRSPRS